MCLLGRVLQALVEGDPELIAYIAGRVGNEDLSAGKTISLTFAAAREQLVP